MQGVDKDNMKLGMIRGDHKGEKGGKMRIKNHRARRVVLSQKEDDGNTHFTYLVLVHLFLSLFTTGFTSEPGK